MCLSSSADCPGQTLRQHALMSVQFIAGEPNKLKGAGFALVCVIVIVCVRVCVCGGVGVYDG